MLAIYCPRQSESSDSGSEKLIPPGHPYLTKVNGRLVMAREKKPKAADIAIDLLGEAFGSRRAIRRRSRSLERPQAPLMIAGPSYYPPLLSNVPSTAPIPQHAYFPQPLLHSQQIQPQIGCQPFNQYQQIDQMYLQQGLSQSISSCQQPAPQPNSQSIMQMPQHQQPQLRHYTVPLAKPTDKDFESLKLIDAHFNSISSKKIERFSETPAPGTSAHEEATTKTTYTITKHVCANCNRLRSRKYHAENPVKTCDTPTPAYCRKCQKDSSSMSESDGGKSSKKKTNNSATKTEQRNQDKNLSEGEKSNCTAKRAKSPHNKTTRTVPKPASVEEDYIIVEEHSEDERLPRSKKESLQIEYSDLERCLVSPLPAKNFARGSQSLLQKQHVSRTSQNRQKGVGETAQRCSRSPYQRFAPTSAQTVYLYQPQSGHSSRESVNSFQKNLYEQDLRTTLPQNEYTSVQERKMRRENGSSNNFSRQSAGTRRRRRVGRANSDITPTASWNVADVFYSPPGKDKLGVEESFAYRPKIYMEEQRRQQENTERATYASRSAEMEQEASKYYNDNWSREEPVHAQGERRGGTHRSGRYRRDSINDSELANSESTGYCEAYDAIFHDVQPAVPKFPYRGPASTPIEARPVMPLNALHSEEGVDERFKAARRDKGQKTHSLDRLPNHHSGTSSSHRPPFVIEETDVSKEKTAVSSPRHSPQQTLLYDDDYLDLVTYGNEQALVRSPKKYSQGDSSYDDEALDMMERERLAEAVTGRVKFRLRSPSSSSVASAWSKSDRSDSFLRRKTSWDYPDPAGRW